MISQVRDNSGRMKFPFDYRRTMFHSKNCSMTEDKTMPYVTSVERIGIQKGFREGMQKGLQQGEMTIIRHLLCLPGRTQ